MPGRDQTGPEGVGPMTGRRMGACAGYPAQGYGRGRGFARLGMAFRHGGRNWGQRPGWDLQEEPDQVDEKDRLETEVNDLKRQLDGIQERLKRLQETPE